MMTQTRLPMLSVLVLSALSTGAYAHDRTDWRKDHKAFRTARPVNLPDRRDIKSSEYPDLGIEAAYIKEKLSQLSGAAPVTIDGKQVVIPERGGEEGRELARKFLAQEYAALGYQVSTHEFRGGANFIAEKRGSDASKVLIVSSHIDSVNNAGANDDGMGTIGALAIARALAKQDLHYTLRILGFDREEIGLVGSKAYVKSLGKDEEILGDIEIEMMGTNSRKDGAFHVIDCEKPGSPEITAQIMNAVVALKLPLKRVEACTDRSDHAAFWKAKIPAVVLSENFFGGDSDPCYHQKCDRLDDRLDFDYAARITNAVGSAVAHMIQ